MFARHITLTANVVSTVTMDRNYANVELVNRDGAAEVYYTRDGSTPTVGGNDTFVLPAAIGGEQDQENTLTFKLISAGTPKVSVVAR